MSGWERAINMNCKSDAELGGMFAHIPPIQGFFVFFASPALRIFNSKRFRVCEKPPEPHHFDPECGSKCNIRTGDKFHDPSQKRGSAADLKEQATSLGLSAVDGNKPQRIPVMPQRDVEWLGCRTFVQHAGTYCRLTDPSAEAIEVRTLGVL